MQFSSIITSLVAAASAASAVAVTSRDNIAPRALSEAESSAKSNIQALEAQGCDVFGCISAFAPSIGVCAIALIEPTPVGEIACFLAILEKSGNPPASCNGCL